MPNFQEIMTLTNLPYLNAFFNACCLFQLLQGIRQIKKGNRTEHKHSMLKALFWSILFLISYLTYHYHIPTSPFVGANGLRVIFLFILFTHIACCFLITPMVPLVFILAYQKKWIKHARWAKITFPLWVYVSLTGILIVLFSKFLSKV